MKHHKKKVKRKVATKRAHGRKASGKSKHSKVKKWMKWHASKKKKKR